MSNRSATDTIRGYFYQFDYTIEKLLDLPGLSDMITVEGIEDVDIDTTTESTAIQCKYYSKTDYNHSVIAKPIRLMLNHFKDVKKGIRNQVKYYLYGYYNSGQEKLTLPINILFLKENFLTYTSKSIKHEHHTELNLLDSELQEFLDLLTIDINAKEYELQFGDVINKLSSEYNCDLFEAEYYFYNNALNEIRKIATKENINNRRISKGEFLRRINNKIVLFNKWFLELKGQVSYHQNLKRKYFTSFNKNPFERFFIIELPSRYTVNDLKELILFISNRYSNLKQREPNTFCPYVCFSNIKNDMLIELKQNLFSEDFNFIDGKPFEGSLFSIKAIQTKATYENQLKIKIIKNITELEASLAEISKTKEVYQFYMTHTFLSIDQESAIKNVAIQISDINHIKEII